MNNDKLQGERELVAAKIRALGHARLMHESDTQKELLCFYPQDFEAAVMEVLCRAALASDAEPVYQTLIHGGVWNDCSKEVFEIALRDGLVPARVLYLAPPSTAQAVEAMKEKCAAVCDAKSADWRKHGFPAEAWATLDCADEIRDIPTEAAQPVAPNATRGDTDPPKESGDLWTAGINLGRHGNAIECYRDTRQEAEALRDKVLEAITSPQAGAQVERDAELIECLELAQNGLRWYQAEHPEHQSEADEELHMRIDAAISSAKREG